MELVALLIWPVFFVVSSFLFKKAKLKMHENTYSNLGATPTYGVWFNVLLVSVGTLQLIFLYSLMSNLSQWGLIGLYFFMTTTLMGILTGIISENFHHKVHLSCAIVGFLAAPIGYILVGAHLLPTNTFVGVAMFIWGVMVMPYQVLSTPLGKNMVATNELFMFLGAFITNILFAYLF